MKKYPKYLHLSDPHIPYSNLDYWRQAFEFNKKFKADYIDSTGDFLDQYALSRFPKKVNSDNGHIEILKCIPQVRQIVKWFPNMKIMHGNHDERINKRAQDAGISDLWLKKVDEMIGFPKGWSWYDEDIVKVGPAILTHGFLGTRAKHAAFFNENVVHGHLHSQLGIDFFQRNGKAIWVCCAGAMADRDAVALQYGPIKKLSTMTPGLAWTDEYGNPGVLHFKG